MPGLRLLPCKTLEEFKLVFGCLDEQAACMARGGAELGADRLLWGLLQPRGEQWLLRLQWFEVASARSLNVVELALPAMADRETVARALTPALRRLLGLRLGTLILRLPLAEVEVWVDGQRRPLVAGRVFRATELPRGSHRVEVRKQGYLRWQREVQIAADLQTDLVVSLRLARAGAGGAGPAAAAD
ncbi:MAG: carboxypeptidase regulatory-like domain-containing protein [Proteobacteria bacterium]|nr:carboxypeptidase regulatory-like domain-containing protein [Pseudomonadota bacterium]